MKILHLSNIANNAYLNAKILNNSGIKSDVLSQSYYHIMGCPEWEDADFIGDYGEDNNPDWSKVNLSGFKRPDWFAQGRKEVAIKYLIAKNKKRFIQKAYYGLLLKTNNLLYQDSFLLARRGVFFLARVVRKILGILRKIHARLKKYFLLLYMITLFVVAIVLLPITLIFVYRFIKQKQEMIEVTKFNAFWNNKIEQIKNNLMKDFPERYNNFNISSLEAYRNDIYLYKKLFDNYDIVIGYGIDGLLPLLAGKKYIAFEHGTLRNLPYQDDGIGLRTLLSYKYAEGVIITNADNVKSAKKLELKNYMFIPHPINEDPLERIDTSNIENLYKKYNTNFIVFHPSRQHWEDRRHPDWEKGNDIYIRGFAKFVKDVNPKAKSIFVSWGQKVEESKQLIKNLDIEKNIIWIKPQHNFNMIKIILSSDLVADQFYLGAFGSTMPKALLCSKPSMLYLDDTLHDWCFEEMPPILNTKDEVDVFKVLKKLYKDKEYSNQLKVDSKAWYDKYHSNELILNKLEDMFKTI